MQHYLGFIFATISMVTLGVANFYYKKSTLALGPVNTTFYYYLFSLAIALCVWAFYREKEFDIRSSAVDLMWPFIIAVFLFSSVLSFNFAVKYINVSTGSTIRGLSFLVTIALGLVVYNESFTSKDYVALALALISIGLFTYDGSSPVTTLPKQ